MENTENNNSEEVEIILPNESKIQQQIFIWFNNNFCLKHHNPRSIIWSVPNGGTRNKIEAIILKATGLLPGVSDLILIHLGKVVFVEVKTPIGKQSVQQIDFEQRIKNNGFEYHLVRSLDEFKQILS